MVNHSIYLPRNVNYPFHIYADLNQLPPTYVCNVTVFYRGKLQFIPCLGQSFFRIKTNVGGFVIEIFRKKKKKQSKACYILQLCFYLGSLFP